MTSENNTLTENEKLENENEKIMMSHIKKIIIEQKTNDAEDVTNKLRRKYDKYNLKKRKYVKKVVQKVLSSLNEENSNDSVAMAEMLPAEKNGVSSLVKKATPEHVSEKVDKRHETVSDDINVTDEESSDISDVQTNSIINHISRKRPAQNSGDELLNDGNQLVVNKKRCLEKRPNEKRSNEKQSNIVRLSDFVEDPAIDRSRNLSKVYGRSQIIPEIKEYFSTIQLRKIAPSLAHLLVIFAAPKLEGKRYLAQSVAAEYDMKFYEINFRNVFKTYTDHRQTIDYNLDSVLLKCANQKTLIYFSNLQLIDKEYISMLMLSETMHDFMVYMFELKKKPNVFVIGGFQTCSKVYSIPDFLYKFDRILYFNIPTSDEKLELFDHLIKQNADFDFKIDAEWIVKNSPRFLLQDTLKLFSTVLIEAIQSAQQDTIVKVAKSTVGTESETDGNADADAEVPDSTSLSKSSKKTPVTKEHFFNGLEKVQKHVALEQKSIECVEKVSWDDIGSLKSVKKSIRSLISQKLYKINTDCQGVLLYGPPGCGKTLIARALANEHGFNFISVRGAEFMNKYVGDSQKAVHECFRRAVTSAPSIIFFDEIDAICGDRSKLDSTVAIQVSAALLIELDGLQKRDVFVVATTNRLTTLDKAFTRPGRFSRIFYVGLPTTDERIDILKTICKSKQILLCDDVDLEAVAKHERCRNYSGADLKNLINVAKEIVFEREEWKVGTDIKIDQKSLLDALEKTKAIVSDEDLLYYKDYEPKRSNI